MMDGGYEQRLDAAYLILKPQYDNLFHGMEGDLADIERGTAKQRAMIPESFDEEWKKFLEENILEAAAQNKQACIASLDMSLELVASVLVPIFGQDAVDAAMERIRREAS